MISGREIPLAFTLPGEATSKIWKEALTHHSSYLLQSGKMGKMPLSKRYYLYFNKVSLEQELVNPLNPLNV